MPGRHLAVAASSSATVPTVALSAGWGSTATAVLTGGDNFGKLVISAAGSSQGANPTVTLTFGDAYTPGSTPVAVAVQDFADSAKGGFLPTASGSDATKVLFTYTGTPSGSQTYTLNYALFG